MLGIPDRSLFDIEPVLEWQERIDIAIEAAGAYLLTYRVRAQDHSLRREAQEHSARQVREGEDRRLQAGEAAGVEAIGIVHDHAGDEGGPGTGVADKLGYLEPDRHV